jgi:hypothetical protein
MWSKFKRWSFLGNDPTPGDSEYLILGGGEDFEAEELGGTDRVKNKTMTTCALSSDEGFFSNSSSNADMKEQEVQPKMRGRATTLGVPREQRFSLRLGSIRGSSSKKAAAEKGKTSNNAHGATNGKVSTGEGPSSGELPRRTQSFVVKSGSSGGSKLMKPGFLRQQQQGRTVSSTSSNEHDGRSGSVTSGTSLSSTQSEDVGQPERNGTQKNTKVKEYHIRKNPEPSPNLAKKPPHPQPVSSFRSKSLGREGRHGDRTAFENPLQSAKVGGSKGVGGPKMGVLAGMNGVKKSASRDHPVIKPPAGGSGQSRISSRASSTATSPAGSRSSSVRPSTSSLIPPPRSSQQSSLARIASRLASLVSLGNSGRTGVSPTSAKDTTPKSNGSSVQSRLMQPTITDIEMSPLTGRRKMVSPPGSKIPRPTSSLSSSRRSSAASSPEPERVRRFSPPGLGAESQTGPQYSPTVSPTDMGRSRSGSGSISTLVERSLKAIPKGPPHTPTLAERAPTDSSPAVPRLRSRTDSESERGSDVPVFGGAEEEQVVLSYEEYWRTQQEVRLVRMMLLKLKKELQEGEGSPCALTGGTSTVSETSEEDLINKLESVAMERDQLASNLAACQQELQSKNSTITELNSELTSTLEKNTTLKEEVETFHRYREEMIAKVERLYAEKHKIEDELTKAMQVVDYYSDSELLASVDGSIELSTSFKQDHKQTQDVSDARTTRDSMVNSQS